MDRLERVFLESIVESYVNGRTDLRVPNTTNIGFAAGGGGDSAAAEQQNICASAGAACSSGSPEPSPVLRAMGIDDRTAWGDTVQFVEVYDRCGSGSGGAGCRGLFQKLRAVLPVGT
jgi:cysteine sulfinate desulfinase/cysteine desulfurase-like protein